MKIKKLTSEGLKELLTGPNVLLAAEANLSVMQSLTDTVEQIEESVLRAMPYSPRVSLTQKYPRRGTHFGNDHHALDRHYPTFPRAIDRSRLMGDPVYFLSYYSDPELSELSLDPELS